MCDGSPGQAPIPPSSEIGPRGAFGDRRTTRGVADLNGAPASSPSAGATDASITKAPAAVTMAISTGVRITQPNDRAASHPPAGPATADVRRPDPRGGPC